MKTPDWLTRRLADTPAPLRDRLVGAVAQLDPELELSEALVLAAERLLDRLRDRLEEREAALDLLVADGLLTLACEAVAYREPEQLAERCRAMGPSGELGRLAGRWAGRS